MPAFNRYLPQKRLLERGRSLASPRSFQTDELFESALGLLLRFGYYKAAAVHAPQRRQHTLISASEGQRGD